VDDDDDDDDDEHVGVEIIELLWRGLPHDMHFFVAG
jgi:hypothetical protein